MGYRNDYFNRNLDSNNGWYKCIKCGNSFRKGDMDIDHIIPQKYGGSDNILNLQCICKHCNRSKGANMSESFSDLFRSVKREALNEHNSRKAMHELKTEYEDDEDDFILNLSKKKQR